MNRNEILKISKTISPLVDKELCFFSPKEVLNGLNNKRIKLWHKYIKEEATPESKSIGLFFPCAWKKPYIYGKTISTHYNLLYNMLDKGNLWNNVAIQTVSVPLGIVNYYDYNRMPIYDCSGLYKEFVHVWGTEWDQELYEKSFDVITKVIEVYLKRIEGHFKKLIGFFPKKDVDGLMLKKACENLGININFPLDDVQEDNLKIKINYDKVGYLLKTKDRYNVWNDKIRYFKILRLMCEFIDENRSSFDINKFNKFSKFDISKSIELGLERNILIKKDGFLRLLDNNIVHTERGSPSLSKEEISILQA